MRWTHLSNERAFLAWLQIGLTIVGFGMASEQFLERKSLTDPPFTFLLSALLVGIGLSMVGVGWHQFHRVHAAIDAEEPRGQAGAAVAGIALAAILAGFISAIILVLIEA